MHWGFFERYRKFLTYYIFDIFLDKKPLFQVDYEKYWELRRKHFIPYRFLVMKNIIPFGSSVLDIGCGDGSLGKLLIDEKNCPVFGVDISATALRYAKEKGLRTAKIDLERGSLPNQYFDYIIASEFIEHIQKPDSFLITLKKYKTKIIITIPNTAFYTYRLRLLFGKFPLQWAMYPHEHVNYWSIHDFKFYLKELGFSVQKTIPTGGIPYLRDLWPNLFSNQALYIITAKDK